MKTQETETNARRLINTVTASLCTVLFAGAVILFAPGTGISQTTDPVGSPKTANVNLDKTVIVTNSELAPVPVRDILRKPTTPVFGSVSVDILSGDPHFASNTIYTVPAGKRLVIEFIAAELSLGPAVKEARVAITTHFAGGSPISFPLALVPKGGEFKEFGFTGMTKIYADAGTDVRVTLMIFEDAFNTRTNVTFIGYLEDV